MPSPRTVVNHRALWKAGRAGHTHPSDGTGALGVVARLARVGAERAPRVGGHVPQVGRGKGGHEGALPRPEERFSASQGQLQSPRAALPAAAVTLCHAALFPESPGALEWGCRRIPRAGEGRARENWVQVVPFQGELHSTLVCRRCFLLPLFHLSSSQRVPSFSRC